MARLGNEGISDILAISFMFVVMVFAGVLLHGFALAPLESAADRQLSVKAEHLYKTLEFSHVQPYPLSFLAATVENLALREPTVPSDYLSESLENALEYLCPPGYVVLVKVAMHDNEERKWIERYPSPEPSSGRENFAFRGTLTLIRAEAGENRVVRADVEVVLFRP